MSSKTSLSRVWLITGANAGLGLELSLKVLSEGERVVAAVRTPSAAPSSLDRPDVAIIQFNQEWSQERIDVFAQEAFAAFGKIDVVVNNAGYGYCGAIEESTDEALKKQYDVNVFGPIRVIRAVLPTLRAQGSGTIANLSSVGGFKSFPGWGMYCSTKSALEGLTFALAEEIESFGLRAMVIQPGYFRTEFLAKPLAGVNSTVPLAAYEGTKAHQTVAAIAEMSGRQPGDPKLGAVRMWEAITGEGLAKGKKLLLRVPLGTDAGKLMRATAKELSDTADEWEDVWSSTDFKE